MINRRLDGAHANKLIVMDKLERKPKSGFVEYKEKRPEVGKKRSQGWTLRRRIGQKFFRAGRPRPPKALALRARPPNHNGLQSRSKFGKYYYQYLKPWKGPPKGLVTKETVTNNFKFPTLVPKKKSLKLPMNEQRQSYWDDQWANLKYLPKTRTIPNKPGFQTVALKKEPSKPASDLVSQRQNSWHNQWANLKYMDFMPKTNTTLMTDKFKTKIAPFHEEALETCHKNCTETVDDMETSESKLKYVPVFPNKPSPYYKSVSKAGEHYMESEDYFEYAEGDGDDDYDSSRMQTAESRAHRRRKRPKKTKSGKKRRLKPGKRPIVVHIPCVQENK